MYICYVCIVIVISFLLVNNKWEISVNFGSGLYNVDYNNNIKMAGMLTQICLTNDDIYISCFHFNQYYIVLYDLKNPI